MASQFIASAYRNAGLAWADSGSVLPVLSRRTVAHSTEENPHGRHRRIQTMKSERLNSWLQIASNLGLIAGLVLVAVQIQQTRDLTRLQMQLDRVAAYQQMEQGLLGEEPGVAWAKSIRDPTSLSDAEVKSIDSFLINQVKHWDWLVTMENAGLEELGALERSVREEAWFYFGNPFAKRWWVSMRDPGKWDPDLVRLLDAQIAKLGDDVNARWLDEMRSPVRPGGS
jgi:hypothetical protein